MINSILDDRYEILEHVGSGGMADVYRAHDKLLDRFVAVKILHKQFASDKEFVDKFRREAQGAARLSHPNIVNIYDVGQCPDNIHYIVMEYVSGETLKDKITRENVIEWREAVAIAGDIANALEHAHQNNLAHCDIKPHNILLMANGHAKVTDFGIARAVTSTTMTYNKNIIGSVHYFSPEQARGSYIGTQSDIYSLGVVLYEMLTGNVPFSGETSISIALKHLQETPLGIRKLNPSVPAALERLVFKAMAKEPADRYNDITAMLEALRGLNGDLDGDDEDDNEFHTKVMSRLTEQDIKAAGKPSKTRYNIKKILLLATVVLTLGFLLGLFLSYGKFWSTNEITVPDVVGKQLSSATHMLESANLKVSIVEIFDENAPAGQVVLQQPEAGATVKEQRMITISVSKGGEVLKTPDLKGLTKREAELKLKNMGLTVGNVDEQYSKQPFSTVLSQSPSLGMQILKGYPVDLIISKGEEPQKIIVPDFKNVTLEIVKEQLTALNLQLGKVSETTDKKAAAGVVFSQNPPANSEVIAQTSVDLTIGKIKIADKTKDFKFTVPDGSSKQIVRIIITDDDGRRIVYENIHQRGDVIEKSISGNGSMRLQVYINSKLVQEKTL